jgi:hypothetical protein
VTETPLDLLVVRMRQLRQSVREPTLEHLSRHAQRLGMSLPPQTLSPILRGDRIPRWGTVRGFVLACEQQMKTHRLDVEAQLLDLATWRALWEAARRPAPPAGGPGPTPAPWKQDARPGPHVVIRDSTGVIHGDNAVVNIAIDIMTEG